jgi:spermidine synthase
MSDNHTAIRLALASVFGREWLRLTETDKDLIVRDCTEGDRGLQSIADSNDYASYRQNIGTGNLESYVRRMRVRFNK